MRKIEHELVSSRYEANLEIVKLLHELVEESKTSGIRFHQLLYAMDVEGFTGDKFNEESQVTLDLLKDKIAKWNSNI